MSYLTPQEIADKQIANTIANVESYKKGVMATKKNPMQRAIAQIPKMKLNFNKAIDDGRVKEGLESVSEAEWKSLTAGKGADNLPGGLQAARQKIVELQTQLKDHQDQIIRELESMPSTTKAENKARMNHNFERMSQFRFIRRPRR